MCQSERMRPWPETILPVPRVAIGTGSWIAVNDELLQWQRADVAMRHVELPAEFWLRELLQLDVDSPTAAAKFSTDFGMLDPHALDVGAPRDRISESVYLDEFSVAMRRLRNIARIVRAVASDSPRQYLEDLEEDGLQLDGRTSWAVRTLDKALVSVHPRIILVDEIGLHGDPQSQATASLFAAIGVQMYNFIVEQPHLSVCQRCGVEHVHQRGRGRYGGHRPAHKVKYCSWTCANAASSAAYNARKRAEARAAKGGETK